jgi:hypothetical protein
MTADDFRRAALNLEGANEGAHMGHPDFRANGRIFATLTADEQWGVVMVTPEEQRELLRTDPAAFAPASGAWGRQGCTRVRLEAADAATVRGAMMLAWERVTQMPPSRSKKAPRTAVKPRPRTRRT